MKRTENSGKRNKAESVGYIGNSETNRKLEESGMVRWKGCCVHVARNIRLALSICVRGVPTRHRGCLNDTLPDHDTARHLHTAPTMSAASLAMNLSRPPFPVPHSYTTRPCPFAPPLPNARCALPLAAEIFLAAYVSDISFVRAVACAFLARI